MNTAQRLRALAKRTALDGIGEELMAIAEELEGPSSGSDAEYLAIAESVGLIGPRSRVGDTHNAVVRFGRALTQALATAEPGFDGSVIVGHSKHRGGWFVFEEFAEGEFTPIKGPFSSKDEADRAMRDPHAPLIQHATTAPDVPETNFGNTTERKGEPIGEIVRSFGTGSGLEVRLFGGLTSDTPGIIGTKLYTSPQVPEDTERLDWIERQYLEDLVMCLVIDAPNDGKYSVCGDSGQPGYGKTLREAIDAARKGE